MKALVVYDSIHGNTKAIAEAVAGTLGKGTPAVSVEDFKEEMLAGVDLLIAGSPIIAWRPSEKMGKFLAGLKRGQLAGMKAAAFDTRIKAAISGDAAKKIAKALVGAGAEVSGKPTGFHVKGREGPLAEGEVTRAVEWGMALIEGMGK
jgi:menaquinone-dependent protoporphyrinogen IX oxidase